MANLVNSITGGNPNFTPERPQLTTAATLPQVTTAYDQTQQGLNQQQQFLQALQAQNGLGNQSSVFNQMQNVASGQGPNPAQAMLNNATGQNIAAQTAMMAGQRGASANPALIARQAAQQGANTQQQAVGQGAALQAQQSLNALGQMGNIANTQAAQQQAGLNAYNQAAQNQQQNLLNAVAQQNATQAGVSNTINQANAQLAGIGQQAAGNLVGNIMGGAGAAATMMKAEGGEIAKGPRSKLGQHFHAMANGGQVPALLSPGEKYLPPAAVNQVQKGANPMAVGQTVPGTPKVGGAKNSYANDTVKATLQEGGIVLPRSVTQSKDPAAAAHKFVAAILAKKGKSIPKKGK